MRKIILLFAILSLCVVSRAQTFTGQVKDAKTHKPIDYSSVVAMDSLNNPLAFCSTDEKGGFSLEVKPADKVSYLSVSFLGYATQKVLLKDYCHDMTINLSPESIVLKEVEVKSKRLEQKSDTLIYSVAGFRQKQDRSIADVIAKMPGLDVSDNGTITYQGKPINKFYIEGMDLMGGKYAIASENLSAKKVKSVEVMRKHQPIKALKGVSFSDQAALNLVLEDDAKNVINASLEIGAGAQLQNSPAEDFLRDCRAIGMLFGAKRQNLTMYKCNNTGKDVQHEIRDLTSDFSMNDESDDWLSDIEVSAPDLKLERYNCNDTHLAATNWLFKLDADTELRFQGTYLFDKTIGYKKDVTTYTSILNLPVIEEEIDASKYRRELNAELQYKKNSNDLFINNVLKSSFNWNESSATTSLNGKYVSQEVKPRKSQLVDMFSFIKNLENGKSLNLDASINYQYLPGTLMTLVSSTPQSLNVNSLSSMIRTGFRHKVLGMYISYNAQVSFLHDHIELNEKDKMNYQEMELMLTPRISYEKGAFRSAFSLPSNVVSYRMADLRRSKFNANPYLSLGYKIGGTMDVSANYSHQNSCYETSTNVPFTYFISYATRTKGDGQINLTSNDNFEGKFDYSNPNIGLFFYVSGNYISMHDIPMYCYSYDNDIYTIESTGLKSRNEQIITSAEVSKTFGYGKFTMTIGGDYLQHNFNSWMSSQINCCHLKNYSANLKFAIMPSPLFSIEEKSVYCCAKTINTTFPELNTKAVNTFKHHLSVFFMPGKWTFSLGNDLYHSNDSRISTAYFADFKCMYTKKRYEISFLINNIFGTKSYEQNVVTSTTNLLTINNLRPREFVAKIAFSL